MVVIAVLLSTSPVFFVFVCEASVGLQWGGAETTPSHVLSPRKRRVGQLIHHGLYSLQALPVSFIIFAQQQQWYQQHHQQHQYQQVEHDQAAGHGCCRRYVACC